MSTPSSPKQLPKSALAVIVAAAFLIYCLGVFVESKSKAPGPIGPFLNPTTATPVLKVQIVGQVKSAGVYDLPSGARVQDAINAAGGTLPDADLRGLNLAGWVTDGSKIIVPSSAPPSAPIAPVQSAPIVAPLVPEATTAPPDGTIPKATRPAGGQSVNADVEYLKKNPLDLNLATEAQLETLPGVGPKMAAKIVAYRAQIGRFSSTTDLDNVPGIGAQRLAVIRPLIVVN